MPIAVRLKPEFEQQLDQLAERMGKSRSACVREAIAQYLQRFGNNDEALRLHSFYTGVERMLLLISRVVNGGTPSQGEC